MRAWKSPSDAMRASRKEGRRQIQYDRVREALRNSAGSENARPLLRGDRAKALDHGFERAADRIGKLIRVSERIALPQRTDIKRAADCGGLDLHGAQRSR